MSAREIWTVGHSNKTLETFLSLLHAHRIEALADVRRFPGSRRHPHFNSDQLALSLKAAGIKYFHFPELGGRRKARKDSPNTAWRNESFRGYADFMETNEFKDGMARLLTLAEAKRTAIMCAEVLWWQCHRGLIADYLKCEHHFKVWHILSEEKLEEHPLTAAAREVNGKLTYAPQSANLELEFP